MFDVINRKLNSPRALTNVRNTLLLVLGFSSITLTQAGVRVFLDKQLFGPVTVGWVFGVTAVYIAVASWMRKIM